MQTESTKECYLLRASQLIARAQSECNELHISELQISRWLIDNQSSYSKATWRQYKASVIYDFNQRILTDHSNTDITTAINMLQQTKPPSGRPVRRLTSAQKQKKISNNDLIRLLDFFKSKPSRHGLTTQAWLLAGLWTGLRPCEWQNAQINTANELQVINAKGTNGRAHGITRLIKMTDFNDQEKQIIQLHLDHVDQTKLSPEQHGKSGFELFYSHCRACLYVATRALWPKRKKHISLYSARHQFAANAKFSGLSLEHIAALMGHASIETATSHYGRRSAGTGGVKAKAHSDDVARVTELNQHRIDDEHPRM